MPLRPEDSRWATTHHQTAVEVARNLWAARVYREDPGAAEAGSGRPRVVTDLVRHYLAFARGRYRRGERPTGEAEVCAAALAYLVESCGTTPIEDLSAADLEAVRSRMIDADLKRTTINGYVARIRRMFRWAVPKRYAPAHVAAELAMLDGLQPGLDPSRDPEPIRPVPEADVEATKALLPPTLRDMIDLALATAMRPGELCRLRPADVDRSAPVWWYHVREHKTLHRGHEHPVALGPKAQRMLKPYLKRRSDRFCFEPEEVQAGRGGLQARGRRTYSPHYTTSTFRRAIHRTIDEINRRRKAKAAEEDRKLKPNELLVKWSPNQLRHSAATTIRRELGRDHARAVLGQRSSRVIDAYAEIGEQLAIEAARRLG